MSFRCSQMYDADRGRVEEVSRLWRRKVSRRLLPSSRMPRRLPGGMPEVLPDQAQGSGQPISARSEKLADAQSEGASVLPQARGEDRRTSSTQSRCASEGTTGRVWRTMRLLRRTRARLLDHRSHEPRWRRASATGWWQFAHLARSSEAGLAEKRLRAALHELQLVHTVRSRVPARLQAVGIHVDQALHGACKLLWWALA